jgi:hypothetical protein
LASEFSLKNIGSQKLENSKLLSLGYEEKGL